MKQTMLARNDYGCAQNTPAYWILLYIAVTRCILIKAPFVLKYICYYFFVPFDKYIDTLIKWVKLEMLYIYNIWFICLY